MIQAKVTNISEPIFIIGAATIREHALLLRWYRSLLDAPIQTVLRSVEALALVQAATFDPSRPQHAGWVEVPSWGAGVPYNGTPPYYFDAGPATPPVTRADCMKGTVARRLFELLPPRRLEYLSK